MSIKWRSAAASLTLLLGAACAANNADAPAQAANARAEQPATASILAASKPAAGSTVAPVNELRLHFSPPARLEEVTVAGPDGTMPMMVTAVGEVEHYSLPLSGLGPGRYDVAWRASRSGVQHQGRFEFTVK